MGIGRNSIARKLESDNHTLLLLPLLLLLVSCGPLGKMANVSEADLRSEMRECANIANLSNSKAIACGNFARECRKRVSADGLYRLC